jgi:NADH:ubiquinone oxidoreductase subunit 5 (subunit L)/multisubunit Na+/H+ antiporter MnhA subunit
MNIISQSFILIILLPLIGSFVAGFGSFFIGTRGSVIITVSLMLISNILSYVAYYYIVFKAHICYINLFT